MVKKKLIDVMTTSIEGKLDGNGSLRNVAVSDAWKRLRQSIEVRAWKGAEGILQELSESLQKINMLKAMTGPFSKLKSANPDQMVEESDYITKETPRGDKTQSLQLASDLQKSREEILGFSACLQIVKNTLEKENNVPDKIDIPNGTTVDIKNCYQMLQFVCEKCKKGTRDIEHLKKRIENNETRNKDLEKQMDEKEEKLNVLTIAVDTLEKKHNSRKEEKIDTFKEQMKYKSLERQVENNNKELANLKEENKDLKNRLSIVSEAKGSAIADTLNPFPPARIAEKFTELFCKEWKDAFGYYKSTQGKSEKDASTRLLDILQDSYEFCEERSKLQIQNLVAECLCLGEEKTQNQTTNRGTIEDTGMKLLANMRKQTSKLSCEPVKNAFIAKLEASNEEKYSLQEITDCMVYIEKCVEVGWYMVLQTPPLYIGLDNAVKPNTDIDKTKFDIESGTGSKIDFLKWPPIFFKKDGELMKKGYVQAK